MEGRAARTFGARKLQRKTNSDRKLLAWFCVFGFSTEVTVSMAVVCIRYVYIDIDALLKPVYISIFLYIQIVEMLCYVEYLFV